MNRRSFLKTLVAGTAGLLLPQHVLAEPERRIWALDQTMIPWNGIVHAEDWDQLQEMRSRVTLGDFNRPDGEVVWSLSDPGIYRFEFADAQHFNPSNQFKIDNIYYQVGYISGNTVYATKWGEVTR